MKLHLRYINELKNSLEQEMKLYKKEKEAKRQIMELNVNLMNEMQELKKTLGVSQKENKAFQETIDQLQLDKINLSSKMEALKDDLRAQEVLINKKNKQIHI